MTNEYGGTCQFCEKVNGFTGFRTSVIDGKLPDFAGTINKKAR